MLNDDADDDDGGDDRWIRWSVVAAVAQRRCREDKLPIVMSRDSRSHFVHRIASHDPEDKRERER